MNAKETPMTLPPRMFAKFNIQGPSATKLLMMASECLRCEAEFYNKVAPLGIVRTPKCYFCDYSEDGAFCLLTEAIEFGAPPVLPLRHRVFDPPNMAEQQDFIEQGCKLHLALWAGGTDPVKAMAALDLPLYHDTHRGMWLMAQLSGFIGLKSTAFSKSSVNPEWQTWEIPEGLQDGDISRLIQDMPDIMASLLGSPLIAYGHNDLVSDNAFYCEGMLGLFDWQQACVNHVGQEWAWNMHWLPPDFLTAHEDAMIDLILDAYDRGGRRVAREDFMWGYVLGCAQMFVWGGGGLHILMKALGRSGHFQRMQPGEVLRNESGQAEKLLGAEMTRRTFTNCCNIMTRHDFVGKWKAWRIAQGKERTRVGAVEIWAPPIVAFMLFFAIVAALLLADRDRF
jgi:hypothetical protein